MHQCLKCKTMFANEEVPIIDGCSCDSKLFLFVKHKGDMKLAEKYRPQLEAKIEEIDVQQKRERTKPASKSSAEKPKFGVETIKVHDIGVYSIHLDALMKGAPIVVLAKGGSYIISFPSLFEDHELEITLK
ncbi:MAG TPA: Zn-ribbon containing protein [Candidatus Nanoarchaeia archaeon]|nr:Zn-ribbon containing protein [Candidatus Nanoarchaeia archaeon]